MSNCLSCDSSLNSSFEERNNYCVLCIEGKLKLLESHVQEIQFLVNENKKIKEDSKLKDEKVTEITRLLQAETQGIESARVGLSDEHNPFTPGNQDHVMWLSGWQSVDTRRRTEQSIAVLRWSTQMLDSVRELALGYDKTEIADKVQTVLEKLRNFLDKK